MIADREAPVPTLAGGDLAPGTMLDRYELVEHVARGGMGSVWRATVRGKHGFSRPVAIKTLLPEHAADPSFRALLLEEARISAKLWHANVAQVLDVGEAGAVVYIAFEWVEGSSLEALCRSFEDRGERPPIGAVLRALAEACAGLHAAHGLLDESGSALDVVHRDVTPSNILVSESGFAKVIDFGVAKARHRIAEQTRTGFARGTPQYMSPEQATRGALDRRADVWSLGAVLFRALTGRAPLPTRADQHAFVHGERGLPELPDDVPPDVRAIVRRALALAPADRFPSADAMREALERAAAGRDDRSFARRGASAASNAAPTLVEAPLATSAPRARVMANASPAQPAESSLLLFAVSLAGALAATALALAICSPH